jgi:hypothetical protein
MCAEPVGEAGRPKTIPRLRGPQVLRFRLIAAGYFVDPYYYCVGDSHKSHLLDSAVGLNVPMAVSG